MDVLMLFLSNLIGNIKRYWKITKPAKKLCCKCHTSLLQISRDRELLSVIHLLITFEMLREWDPEI